MSKEKIDTKGIKEYNNIKEVIYRAAEEYKDKIAFQIKIKTDKKKETEYEYITYTRLLEDINSLGAMLYSKGYKGKRIAVIGKNRYEWIVSHLANLLGGIISIPLDKDLQVDELESSLVRSKADAIVFDSKQKEKIEEVKSRNNTNIKEYISMEELEGYNDVRSLIESGKNKKKELKEYKSYEVKDHEMSVLLFTSGTTSMSKAVMLHQRGIATNIYGLRILEDINSNDTNIAFLPFHHIFGSTGMLYMLSCGVKTVFPDGLKYIQKNLNEYHVSVFVGVPVLIEAMYKAVTKEIERQGKTKLVNNIVKISNGLRKVGIDLRKVLFKSIINALGGSLREIVSGGASADAAVAKGFENFGVITVQGYGLTETSPVIAAETPKSIRQGSVGKPFFNQEVEIVNKDDEGIGEIRVKGPNLMMGYYEMEEKTNEVLKDGWFYTGDLGYIDDDGYLFITGRSKNLIVLKNGKKIFPEELETMLLRLDEIEECMVFGLPEEDNENDVKLSVKVVYNQELFKNVEKCDIYNSIWEKIKEINKTFPKYKHIVNLMITDQELIKTTTKKVKRQEEMKVILNELKGE